MKKSLIIPILILSSVNYCTLAGPERFDDPHMDFESRQIAIAKSESILNSMDAFIGPVIEQGSNIL